MIPERDFERLQAYLDGASSAQEVRALESRLKTEVQLAQALLSLAQEEAVLLEWSVAQAGIRSLSAGFSGTSEAKFGSNKHGPISVPDGPGAPSPQEARVMLMQANCPGCRSTLKIPAGWMHQPIRCKHCGMVIQLQQKAAVPPPAIPVGRAAIPMGHTPPAAIMASHGSPPPAALRVPQAPGGAYGRRGSPNANPNQKFSFVAVWLVGLAVIVGAVFGITQFSGQFHDSDPTVAYSDNGPGREPNTDPDDPKALSKKNLDLPAPPTAKDPSKIDVPKNKGGLDIPAPKGEPVEPTTKRPPPPVTKIVPPKDPIRPPPPPPNPNPTNPNPNPPVGVRPIPGNPNPQPMVGGGNFPRRLLAISPNNYLFLNAVSYGSKLRDTHELVTRMSRSLGIPPSQVTEISDAAPTNPIPPLKPIIDKALADFCNSSRAQDRIIILYSGHIFETEEGECYLVPLEGDKDDKDSLVSLKTVFELLAKSKARQKVLILDVCRFNPSRGADRPDSGKMGEKLDAFLDKPPDGVQVWTACVKEQNSCEDGNIINGGIFLNALADALGNDKRSAKLPAQSARDPFPLEELSKHVEKLTTDDAMLYCKLEQTPRLSGEEITDGAAPFNAAESSPAPLKVDWSGGGAPIFGAADPNLIAAILKETAEIPPVKIVPEGVQPIRVATFPLFSAAILKDYKQPDKPVGEFREAVVKATGVLKKHAKAFQEDFRSANADQLKQAITPVQRTLAEVRLELEEALEAMESAGKMREEEKNKRWLANYDYVMARLKMRYAYVFEYQYVISDIRTDSLPERPEGSPGWRLASQEKMQCKGEQGKDAKKKVEEAKEALKRLSEEHKGTPWEILGKRESLTNLGLSWQPIGGAGK